MCAYTLKVTCKVAPEYVKFYENELLQNFSEKEGIYAEFGTNENPCSCTTDESCECYYIPKYRELSKKYRDLVDLWMPLKLTNERIHQELKGDELLLKFSESWSYHSDYRNLQKNLEECLREIIVPTTTEIYTCVLKESTGWGDPIKKRTQFTDMQLRNRYFRLSEQIKSLHHVWKDGEIVETRVVYKRSIPAKLKLDLERAYY
jgi:hypothetical protein